MKGHELEVIDRGPPHKLHRYVAACSCGWPGSGRKTEAATIAVWRAEHLDNVRRAQQRDRRNRMRSPVPGPRAVTPAARLPEGLR